MVGIRSAVGVVVACVSVAVSVSESGAQTIPPRILPGEVQGGRFLERLQPPEPREPELGPITVPQSAPTQPPAGAESLKFVLRDVVLEGVQAYDVEIFRPLFAGLIGQQTNLATLFQIADQIGTRYRDDGYFLSRALVPAQTVKDGVFRIQVIEGYISDVQVEGDVGAAEALIQSYLDRLKDIRPVSLADVERYLLLANDIPGIAVQGNFRRSTSAVGSAQLVATATRKPFDAFAAVDNFGSHSIGPVAMSAGGAINSFTSFGERLSASILTSVPFREQRIGQIGYEQRLGASGLVVNANASYGVVHPGALLLPLNVRGDTTRLTVGGRYPLIRSRDLSLTLLGGFDYVNANTDVMSTAFTRDRLRVFFAAANLAMRDSLGGATAFSTRVRQGVDVLGASTEDSQLLSRVGGSGVFTTVRADLSRIQPLFSDVDAYVAAAGQYSPRTLLASEEFSATPLSFGRGYDPADLSGDRGIGATVELRYTLPLGFSFLESLQFFTFADYARVWNRLPSPSAEYLYSAGGGVRATFAHWLSGNIEVAKPLSPIAAWRGDKDRPPRVLVSVSTQY